MSDDLSTLNLRRGERSREIDRLRQHYKNHRDTLTGLIGDAPSEHLANEYERLIGEIDMAARKLDELEGRAAGAQPQPPSAAPPKPSRPAEPVLGTRPLNRTPMPPMTIGAKSDSRTAIIVVAAVVVLGLVGYLIWHASVGRRAARPAVVEQPVNATQSTSTGPTIISPASPPSSLKITPALADYGTIRKGTRAVRQFELVNAAATPVEVQVARSACRCLFYDYKSKLAGNAKETITVTIDGARAKAGELREPIEVTTKGEQPATATFTVQAMVR